MLNILLHLPSKYVLRKTILFRLFMKSIAIGTMDISSLFSNRDRPQRRVLNCPLLDRSRRKRHASHSKIARSTFSNGERAVAARHHACLCWSSGTWLVRLIGKISVRGTTRVVSNILLFANRAWSDNPRRMRLSLEGSGTVTMVKNRRFAQNMSISLPRS
jgi:hypothetical protein